MNGWLIDTNVVSELRRPKPTRSVVAFLDAQPLAAMHISVASIAELRYGIACVADVDKRDGLRSWIDQFVRPMFDGRILPIDEDVMLAWRLLMQKGRDTNYTFPQPDLIIAASAQCRGLIVVSRDRKVFERAGVPVLDPWCDDWPI